MTAAVATGAPRPCPACGSTARGETRVATGKKDMAGGPLTLVRCRDCGASYQPQVPSTESLAAWYDYMLHIPANTALTPLLARRLDRLVTGLEPLWRTGRLLEVGSGGGLFVEAAERHGWRAWATEIAPGWAARLRTILGRDRVHEGELTTAPFQPGSFDVVVMMEVVEHLTEPLPYLEAAFRLLRPGGAVFLTTPNLAGVSGRLFSTEWRVVANEHLNYFTPSSLERLLRRSGLVPSRIWTTNLDMSWLAARLRGTRAYGATPAVHEPPQPTQARASASRDERAPRSTPPGPLPWKVRLADELIELANALLGPTRLGDNLKAIAARPGGDGPG